ncbi:MAG: hypothetical protein SOY06_07650 [Prevotella sp.]|nr:hypothetical protein [Bacteroidales bacterium]MDY4229703.1 hypothetical protein [Prevotella sp.]
MTDPENKDYRPSFTGNQLEKHRLPSTNGSLIILRANCHDTSYQLSRYIEPTATIYRGNWHASWAAEKKQKNKGTVP